MEYSIYVNNNTDKDVLKRHLPKEIFAEIKSLTVLSFFAFPKEEEKEENAGEIPIGGAFFTMEDPARILWIEVREDFYGTDLAHILLEYAEIYLKNQNVSGIFAALYGDYFYTFRGNSFLEKNDFEVVKQNKRLITYRKERLSTSPGVESFCKISEKLLANVVPLDRTKQRHNAPLLDNSGDIRTDHPEYTDNEHSFAYIKENYMVGFAVSVHREETEIFVTDFHVAKHPIAPEATKGLLVMLLKNCIGKKDLNFITKNETQRSLLIQLIGDPDRDVPYWEYYKGLNGREDDIDG